jgi:hypothetical protein
VSRKPQFCVSCGSALAGARYCGSCGADSAAAQGPPAPSFDVDAVVNWLLVGLTGVNGFSDFQREPDGRLRIGSDRVPWWAVLIAIFCFPVGLLALLVKERQTCEVRVFVDAAGSPQLAVTGGTHPAVAKRLKKLGREFYLHYSEQRAAAAVSA